jgi:hypothetical protein
MTEANTAEALRVAIELTDAAGAKIKARIREARGEALDAHLTELTRLSRARGSLLLLLRDVAGEA